MSFSFTSDFSAANQKVKQMESALEESEINMQEKEDEITQLEKSKEVLYQQFQNQNDLIKVGISFYRFVITVQ